MNNRIEISVLDWPECYQCNMSVEDFYGIDQPEQEQLTFFAVCHGRQETNIITYEMLAEIDVSQVKVTRAFTCTIE